MRLFTLIVICLIAGVISAQPSYNYQKRFQVKSGHVEYKLTGQVTGKKSLWFDDFGSKYREEIITEEVYKTRKTTEVVKNHSLSVFDGTYYYNVNMATMEGTQLHKDAVPDFSVLGSGLNDSEMEQLGEGLLSALGGKVEKKSETIMGRVCDVTNLMGATVHVYKGVTLKSYAKIGGVENLEEAVSFDESIKVSASKFQVPATAKIEDVSGDVSGNDGFYDDQEEDNDHVFPAGVDFDRFKAESERIRRAKGYVFAMHDASDGQYSSMWTKGDKNSVGIIVTSLQNNNSWSEVMAGESTESFSKNGFPMLFQSGTFFDEEDENAVQGSILMVEMKSKDAVVMITATPQKSKDELIDLFNQFRF